MRIGLVGRQGKQLAPLPECADENHQARQRPTRAVSLGKTPRRFKPLTVWPKKSANCPGG